ncbi:two-component system, OmpR family, sensor kinase [Anaerolineales bacterium]|nr:two-component system, OmpR family, sensor kinase [Anaerolineales bacterium]
MIPLRWRLTIWHLSLTALGLLGLILFSYRLLSNSLHAEINNTLAERARHVSDAVAIIPNRPIEGISQDATDEFRSPGIYVQIFDSEGALVARSFNLGVQQIHALTIDINRVLEGESFYTVAEISGSPVQLYYQPIQRDGRIVGAIQVGESLAVLESTLKRLRVIYSVGAASVLFFGLLGGWLLSRLGLRPVVRVMQTARDIVGAEDLSRRVPYVGPADEIGALATTFNEMLTRLQTLFESQRRFLAETAHELRTPLASMLGNVDLLATFGENPARRRETIAAIQRTGKHVARLLDDLLLLAQAEAGWHLSSLASIALDDVLMEAYEAAQLITEQVALKVEKCEPAFVRGDADRLRQVFMNLIDNALKHSPPDSVVTLALWREEGKVMVRIRDHGTGIPEDALKRIFDPFFRAPGSGRLPGAGLGLTIVLWIVREHGGDVIIESPSGCGTTVTLSFPAITG